MSAIILDGELKSALAVVRSLGREKVPLTVGSERKTGMALHSRYASACFVYPSPKTHEEAFIATLEREAKRMEGKPVVYALSDATFLAIYRARERLAPLCNLMFPHNQAMETAFDKAITHSLARVSNIPTITTYFPATPTEFDQVGDTLSYPAVIKPRKSLTYKGGRHYFESAVFVHSKDELKKVYDAIRMRLGEAPLIQNRIVGEEYGVETVAFEGKTGPLVVHHRLRSLSPTGGASVLKETISKGALRDMLETYARKIIAELRWNGPIMVEFKVDSDTRTPLLMEVNGRFWGSLPLSVAAGVDMPLLYYRLVTEGVLPAEEINPRDGVVTRHFLGDVRHLLRVIFSRDKMRPHAYPKRIQALKSFFTIPNGTKGDVWMLADPKPAVMEVVDIVKKFWDTHVKDRRKVNRV